MITFNGKNIKSEGKDNYVEIPIIYCGSVFVVWM